MRRRGKEKMKVNEKEKVKVKVQEKEPKGSAAKYLWVHFCAKRMSRIGLVTSCKATRSASLLSRK